MKIASILENQKIEKRIAITPEIAKKYISLGLGVSLAENYGRPPSNMVPFPSLKGAAEPA